MVAWLELGRQFYYKKNLRTFLFLFLTKIANENAKISLRGNPILTKFRNNIRKHFRENCDSRNNISGIKCPKLN